MICLVDVSHTGSDKRKGILAGQKGTLTLNAVNIGLLAAKRGDAIPKRPFSSIETLSDKRKFIIKESFLFLIYL